MRALAFVLLLSLPCAARAELPAKHAESVRVSVLNRAQKALGLRALEGGGWRLELTSESVSADLIDMTPGTPARTLTVAVVGGTLKLDGVRFIAGHVYRVQLNGGAKPSVGLVYLYPDASAAKMSTKKAGTQRVRFDADEPPAAGTKDEGISHVEKGSL
jgi:hypothetical protein